MEQWRNTLLIQQLSSQEQQSQTIDQGSWIVNWLHQSSSMSHKALALCYWNILIYIK